VQSNSQRQVAAAAAKLGLACHLAVYHGRLTPPSADYARTGNVALNKLFGAVLHDVPWTGERNQAIRAIADQLAAEGRKPYVVPYGVSNGLGALGYASTALEIAQQCAALGIAPAAIVHCSGSGATQAGLVLGAGDCLPQTRVIGVDIDAEPARVRADVIAHGRAAGRLAGLPFDERRVEIVAGHAGPAYGVPHDATIAAIKLAARLEGLVLDPVYSGKGMAGLRRSSPRAAGRATTTWSSSTPAARPLYSPISTRSGCDRRSRSFVAVAPDMAAQIHAVVKDARDLDDLPALA
jgi:L-cysteate sulfo-lyase